MYSAFSEFLKKGCAILSNGFGNIASGGFVYQGPVESPNDKTLLVRYTLNQILLEENFEKFVESIYFKFLTKAQIRRLMEAHDKFQRSIKIFVATQDIFNPDVFTITNIKTGKKFDKFATDIFKDDELLENMCANSVRLISQFAIQPDPALDTQEKQQAAATSRKIESLAENIIPIRKKSDTPSSTVGQE